MANYISQHTGAQIDNGVTKANSAVQPSDLTTAIANKQDNLVSGTNIKSLNSATLLGTGNIDINKTTLGLNNVDNTADLAKPISTVTQTALNGKAASVHTHITGDVTGLDTALSGKAASVHNHVTSDVTGLDTALNAKVDKEVGKGLSSSDYTSTEKTKLADIADNANNYSHPANHPPSIITQDASNRFVTDAEKAAWTAKQAALVSGTNLKTVNGQSLLGEGDLPIGAGGASGAWADITGKPAVIAAGDDAATARTAIGLGSVDNTSDAGKPVSTAQQTALNLKVDTVAGKGLSTEDYSTADKTKLDGVATGANAYTHPANHPASIITQDASNRFVTDTEKSTWNSKLAAASYATSSVGGTVKVRLNGTTAYFTINGSNA